MISYRQALFDRLPRWATQARIFRLLYTIALVFDGLYTQLVAAVKYRFPGVYGYNNLALHARERGVYRVPRETDVAFTDRLRNWIQSAATAGSFENIAREVQHYAYPGTPQIQIVQNNGRRFTLSSSGEWTWDDDLVGSWAWDTDAYQWSRFWVLISNTTTGFNVTGTGGLLGAETAAMNGTTLIGSDLVVIGSDARVPQSIREVIERERPPYTLCDCILLVHDPSTFWGEYPRALSVGGRSYADWRQRSHATLYWRATI